MLGDLPLFGSSAPAALRRPIFEIALGGAGADSAGGLLSAAASALGLGGGGAADPWKRSVARITLEAGLAPDVDRVDITLSADSQAPPVALGNEGTVALGYEDEGSSTVYSGRIESIRRDARGLIRITIANGSAALAALRLEQSFEGQSAGRVVQELASQAGVSPGDIADGPDLSFLVLDGASSAWEHIARLARVSGHVARITNEGELDFRPPDGGQPVQTFTWGVDVLSMERTESEPVFDAVTVSGEGAAGSQGADAWNWLVKQPAPVTSSAGAGSRARAFTDRALRSAEAVRAAAQAIADAASRAALTAVLQVPGAPAVVPGARIKVAGSASAFAGEYLVTRVRHTFDKRAGFRSRIQVSGSGGTGGAAGLLGGLL